MKKIKVLRHSNRARDINSRPTTTSDVSDVASRQVPMRVVRNTRRGHLIGGMRDIAHIGWKSWEQSVAEMQRLQERNLHKKANRFHNALKSARTV